MTTQTNPDMPDYLWINNNDPEFHNNLHVEYESFDGGQVYIHERKYKAAIEALRVAKSALEGDYEWNWFESWIDEGHRDMKEYARNVENAIQEINKVIGETE